MAGMRVLLGCESAELPAASLPGKRLQTRTDSMCSRKCARPFRSRGSDELPVPTLIAAAAESVSGSLMSSTGSELDASCTKRYERGSEAADAISMKRTG